MFGGAKEDRTPDLVIANDALSQLSYGPGVLQHGLGTAMRSSVALRTPGCQGPALHLPTCVTQPSAASAICSTFALFKEPTVAA